jgi:hypothetical protein
MKSNTVVLPRLEQKPSIKGCKLRCLKEYKGFVPGNIYIPYIYEYSSPGKIRSFHVLDDQLEWYILRKGDLDNIFELVKE